MTTSLEADELAVGVITKAHASEFDVLINT